MPSRQRGWGERVKWWIADSQQESTDPRPGRRLSSRPAVGMLLLGAAATDGSPHTSPVSPPGCSANRARVACIDMCLQRWLCAELNSDFCKAWYCTYVRPSEQYLPHTRSLEEDGGMGGGTTDIASEYGGQVPSPPRLTSKEEGRGWGHARPARSSLL